MKMGDISYDRKNGRLIIAMNRFVWEKSGAEKAKTHERRRSVLHFDRVTGLRQKNLRSDAPESVLNLLAMAFTETDSPAGNIELTFSGGGAMQVSVECLEVRLTDLEAAWSTPNLPSHDGNDPA